MSARPKTLQQWQLQVEGILLSIQEQFLKFGEAMYNAQKELNKTDYDALITYVGQYSLKDADIKAAIAAFLHEHPECGKENDQRIHPKLVFHGAKNSKILYMDKQDQQRLLNKEKFEVLMPNGKPDRPKTWDELNEVQRNTLIGKGGKILTLQEQRDGQHAKKNAAIYPLGSVEKKGKNSMVMVSRDHTMHLQVTFAEFAAMLADADCLQDLDKETEQLDRKFAAAN